MPTDPELGYWVLTKYEDIRYVSMNPKIFSSQYSTGTLLTLGSEDRRHPKLFKSTIDHMLNLDGEMHLGLRKEHMPFFKPDFVPTRSSMSSFVHRFIICLSDIGKYNILLFIEVPSYQTQ